MRRGPGPTWFVELVGGASVPPHSARVRGAVLGCAYEILMQRDLDSGGGARLREWIRFVEDEKNGPAVWLINRTKRTPMMHQLITAATSDRRDVGRRLDRGNHCWRIQPSAIPQMIDVGIYRRLFLTACLAATNTPAGSMCRYAW